MQLYAQGMNNKQAAEYFGVNRKTIYNWRKEIRKNIVSKTKDPFCYLDLVKEITKEQKAISDINFEDIKQRLLTAKDITELSDLSLRGSAYASSMANLIGKIKFFEFEFLLSELDEKEETIKELRHVIWQLYENCMALRGADTEPFPEITDNIDDYAVT